MLTGSILMNLAATFGGSASSCAGGGIAEEKGGGGRLKRRGVTHVKETGRRARSPLRLPPTSKQHRSVFFSQKARSIV